MPSQNPAQEFSADAPGAAGAALREDIHPYLTQRAGGRDISGLSAYGS